MKLFSVALIATLLSQPVMADSYRLICKNEAASALTFTVMIGEDNVARMTFGSNGQGSTEQQLVDKKTTLKLSESRNDRLKYAGDVIVDLAYVRELELNLDRESLKNRESNLRVNLSISNEHAKYGELSYFVQYGMICSKRIFVY